MSLQFDSHKVDWGRTFKEFRQNGSGVRDLAGLPDKLYMRDGTVLNTGETDETRAEKLRRAGMIEIVEQRMAEDDEDQPKRRGRPSGGKLSALQLPELKTPKIQEALPAGVDEDEEKSEQQVQQTQESPMTSAKRPQNPGSTQVALRDVPLEQIHAVIQQQLYDQVNLRISYKNARGNPIFIGQFTVAVDQLMEIETILKNEFGGGCFRVDARDPNDAKRVAEIPVFEVTVHGPQRIMQNGQILPPGVAPPPQMSQSSPGMWGASSLSPSMPGMPMSPGVLSTPMQGQQPQQSSAPWIAQSPAAPPYMPPQPGPQVHAQPVMAITPDVLAVGELNKAQDAAMRERHAREEDQRRFQRVQAETQKQLDALKQTLAEQRLKEEDRARQMELAAVRDQLRQQERRFEELMQSERNRKPSFDWGGFAAIVSAAVPLVTTVITSSKEQASKSLELQQQGVNQLITATLSRANDGKWVEPILALLPTLMPVVKDWMKSRSPEGQADLVATLSENHLTTIGMIAKLMNEMGAGDNPPVWFPLVQSLLGQLISAAESFAKSNKASVGIPVTSKHLPAQPTQPALTPAQAAAGMMVQGPQGPAQTPMQTPVQTSPQAGFGKQIVQVVMNHPEVPADIKTPEWLHLIERLHDKAPVEEVAAYFATHMRKLDLNLPKMLEGFWEEDNGPKLMRNLFINLPIWGMDPEYVLAFIDKAMDILTEPAQVGAEFAAPDFFTSVAQ